MGIRDSLFFETGRRVTASSGQLQLFLSARSSFVSNWFKCLELICHGDVQTMLTKW